jgi:pimeloyl-ACP methyl ester carboxylesterase
VWSFFILLAVATPTKDVRMRTIEQPYGSATEERGLIEIGSAWKRFVLRYPADREDWNGRLLVAAHGGTGGEAYSRDGRVIGTDETSLDDVVGDHALSLGFAYASFDRDGVGGTREGLLLTETFTDDVEHRVVEIMGRTPDETLLAGLSMGGGIARFAAEQTPPHYDGVLLIAGANGDVATRRARQLKMAELWPKLEGLPDDAPEVLAYAQAVGTPVAARRFWPFIGSLSVRSEPTSQNVEDTTGDVKVPTIDVVGTYDDLVLPEVLAYAKKVERAGAGQRHRLYRVDGAWHISSDDDAISSFQYLGTRRGLPEEAIDAMATGTSYLPKVHESLELLDRWVVEGVAPPEP